MERKTKNIAKSINYLKLVIFSPGNKKLRVWKGHPHTVPSLCALLLSGSVCHCIRQEFIIFSQSILDKEHGIHFISEAMMFRKFILPEFKAQ